MKIHKIAYIFGALSAGAMLGACTQDSPKTFPPVDNEPVVIERGTFAKGADVSWITELESKGEVFFTPGESPVQKELMSLLRDDCGVNSIRLRVWVNPTDGWCDLHDVVVKARRAQELGLRLMIDFHFSDWWADPGKQNIPAAWADFDINQMLTAVSGHVSETLRALKRYGIDPEWVQIGNETTTGMLWPIGHIDTGDNFTRLVNAGYDAVKELCPEAQVIVHVDGGDSQYRFDRIFGKLQAEGGKYDMIGMSLYPEPSVWKKTADDCLANIRHCQSTYGKPVMICEIGMDYREAEASAQMMQYMFDNCRSLDVKGIFWWEPEAPASEGYLKGCFDNGAPNGALDCFIEKKTAE